MLDRRSRGDCYARCANRMGTGPCTACFPARSFVGASARRAARIVRINGGALSASSRSCSPRCLTWARIRSISAGSSMLAITVSRPPQPRQRSISIAAARPASARHGSSRVALGRPGPADRHQRVALPVQPERRVQGHRDGGRGRCFCGVHRLGRHRARARPRPIDSGPPPRGFPALIRREARGLIDQPSGSPNCASCWPIRSRTRGDVGIASL
jgi:hypothetical protein